VEKLLEKINVKHLFSTPYHPQTNGLVERFNRTLCESIAKCVDNVADWDELVPSILFAYRTSRQSTTQMTPFYLVYGRQALLPFDVKGNDNDESTTLLDRINNLVNDLPQIHADVRARIKNKQQKQKNRYDQRLLSQSPLEIGDQVLLYEASKEKQWSGKLEPKWKGPYYIHQPLLNGAYKLRTLDGKVLKTPFNVKLLKKYITKDWVPQVIIN